MEKSTWFGRCRGLATSFSAARQLGPEPLVRWSKLFRFGEPTGVDLPFEQAGHVPSSADNSSGSSYQWYPGDNLGLSIGQSYLTVTPLQMLVMMSAIANGGELVTPSVVSRVLTGEDGAEISETSPQPDSARGKRVEISPETLSVVRGALREVVSNPQGTAFASVNTPRVAISGKTGTAQTGGNRQNHAWFVGYAPAQAPQVAFVVCLEHGGAGGEQAGPLAKAIVEKMVELELITPQ